MDEAVFIQVSCADRAEAVRIGRALVERRLAACVHFWPHGSIYRWQGEIEEAAEYTLLVKTAARLGEAARQLVREMHSYSLPAIFSTPAVPDDATRHWLDRETAADDPG